MLEAFKDEDACTRIYDEILAFAIDHRPWIKQFWDTAESTKAGFLQNGCVIGQTWDGPAVALRLEGQPVGYMAPQEGAIAWADGWALTAAATNLDQAYEFLSYLMTPEASALVAETSRYNPVVAGAVALMPEPARKNFVDAFPDDALQRLWMRRPEQGWYTKLRVRYAEKFRSACAKIGPPDCP
jgi:spermidine/putrescine transport system substrate-binding protein